MARRASLVGIDPAELEKLATLHLCGDALTVLTKTGQHRVST